MTDESAYEKQITPDLLKPGMYVSRLDRPWIETPFLLAGFPITEQDEIDKLKALCKFVYIDVEQGDDLPPGALDTSRLAPASEKGEEVTTKNELPEARRQVDSLAGEISRIFDAAKAGGNVEVTSLKDRVVGLVDSALRNADASLLLVRLRAKDDYSYNHALCVAVMAVALGKRLGFDRKELEALALSASLFDVGKMKVPDPLLQKPDQLSAHDRSLIRMHVEYGVELLRRTDVDYQVVDVAQNHHERFDGSGYPMGKSEDEISMFAQIVGLVDSYDAMVSERIYRSALSHERAVRELYEMRGKAFQAEMLEQFIQCLGTYPVGSIVELTNGDIGIVVQQNGLRRLRPQVMLILDREHKPLDLFPIVNLLNEVEDNDGNPLAIRHTLEPGAHGIDPTEYFL